MTYKTHLGKNNGKYSMRSTTDIIHAGGGCCSDGIKQFSVNAYTKLNLEIIVSNNFVQ